MKISCIVDLHADLCAWTLNPIAVIGDTLGSEMKPGTVFSCRW